MVVHRRAGKTVASVYDLINNVIHSESAAPRYAYVAPTYTQAKDVAWGYLKSYALKIPGVVANETELRIDFPGGGRIRLYGADNYDRMRGIYLDGVILDEYADMDSRAWPEVIRPTLADRQGWGVFLGTPKGQNAFFDLWERSEGDDDWFRLMLRSSESGIIPQAELDDARKTMTRDQYEQEFECSFSAAIQGAYYGDEFRALEAETPSRITNVPHERAIPVHTAWDLGISDEMVIWFVQLVGREVHLIDYHADTGKGLEHYVGVLDEKARTLGYHYGEHYLPHDVQVRELSTGVSRLATLQKLGLRPTVVPNHQVMDGINAVRLLFPRFWIDRQRCAHGIKALKNYRADYDDKNMTLRRHPLHNWASHGADALRYFAAGFRDSPMRDRPVDRYRSWGDDSEGYSGWAV